MTVSRIAKWTWVVGREHETDHRADCPVCNRHNRVRLGKGMVEVDRAVCAHFAGTQNKIREEGVVYLLFDTENKAA